MNDFIVSARKYRPSTFQSVVGQQQVTLTLKNAIRTNHMAHAYLFCGPRGVGKTTCARIFAKTLNCFNRTAETEACNECESCLSFNDSRSYNIHELDAASNNSVEDIRNLIDQVRIPPQVGKYSIYIIDEVHMLSNQAFNAFLKTLEEPPAHAFFILATTEKHKIIPTILSRCQIFDFNRIKIEDTVQYLETISKLEGIEYDVDALNIIASKSEGGLRDALSIYDQMVSYSGKHITYQGVIDSLNVLDYEYYFRIVNASLHKDIATVLLLFDEILNKGFDGHIFINGLASHLRNLLVCKDEATIQLIEAGVHIKDQYKNQARVCLPSFLFESLSICSQCDIQYKISRNPRLHIELALIQLCNIGTEKKNSLNPIRSENNSGSQSDQPINSGKKNTSPDLLQVANEVKTVSQPFPSFSIKDALKTVVNPPTPPDTNPVLIIENEMPDPPENQTFTQQELIQAWEIFALRFKDQQPRMYSTLLAQIPVLKENFQIELVLNNQFQEEEVHRIEPSLIKFLQNELKNNTILLDTRIIQSNEEIKKYYTDKEKFDHLVQKNSSLINFKQQFGLDFG